MRSSGWFVLLSVGIIAWGCDGFCRIAGATTIAYWRFENDLLDETGNHDATHLGTDSLKFSIDLFGNPVPRTGAANARSLELGNPTSTSPPVPSATDYLTVDHASSLNIATGSFTIEAYVKLDQAGANSIRQYLVQKNSTGAGDEGSSFIFMAKAGSLLPSGPSQSSLALALPDGVADAVANENYIFSSLGITDNDWHHISVALERSTGDVRFTLDELVDLQPGAAAGSLFDGQDNTAPLYIGGHPTGVPSVNHGFDGYIDELRISDEFLATNQLLAVPEPSAAVTMIAGIILLLTWRRWRKRGRNT